MPGFEVELDLPQGWERTETATGIPYYVNHDKEITQWDHPEMIELMTYLSGLDKIKYAAYRTAMKLRAIQKKTNLYLVELTTIRSVLQQQGFHNESFNDSTIMVSEVESLIANIFIRQFGKQDKFAQEINQVGLQTELVLNWLLNAYDSGRTGYLRLISIKIGLVCLCSANLQDKYNYLFTQICDNHGRVDKKRLRTFLKDCLQIPKTVMENTAFGGLSVEPAVKNCLERVDRLDDVLQQEFIDWMVAEPQTIVWLPTLHRLAIAETVKHESKCNICKMYPIVGFRYKCLKCFNFDLCQECFWSGRVSKQHKVGHPTQEYCLASTQKEDMKDFAKVMKNKVSKKKKKPTDPAKRRFIPIPLGGEEPSSEEEFSTDAPSMNKSTQKTHENIEHFAARLADEEKLMQGIPEPELDDEPFYPYSSGDDEHKLIQRFSSRLAGESFEEIPDQFDRQPLSQEQRMEVENLVTSLEEDNRVLHDEIEKIRQLRQQSEEADTSHDENLALWEDRERMLAREEVLKEHNKQLEFQINRLRRKLHQVSNSSFESQSSENISPIIGPASFTQPLANIGQGIFPGQQQTLPIFRTFDPNSGNPGQTSQVPVGSRPGSMYPSVTDPSALLYSGLGQTGQATPGNISGSMYPSVTDPLALAYPGQAVQTSPGSISNPMYPSVTDPSALLYPGLGQTVQTAPGNISGPMYPSVTDPSALLHPSFTVNAFSKPSPFLSDQSNVSHQVHLNPQPMTSPAVMQSVASNTAMISKTSLSFPSVTSPTALSSLLAGLSSQTWTVTTPVMTPFTSTMTSPATAMPHMSPFSPLVMPVHHSSRNQPLSSGGTFVQDKPNSFVIGDRRSLLFPSHEEMKAWPGPMPYEWSVNDENELNSLVDKMSSSFLLDAQSDTPVEFYNDLLVAANMVGEAVEDLVGTVSSAAERR